MAEKEYIEREAAKNSICQYCRDIKPENCKHKDECNVICRLDAIPAADVRPAVRGKWVKARGSWCTPGGDPVWECSECGKGRHVYGIEHGSYGADVADGQWVACPNCGADMREES